jgi:hypothetical protein
MASPPIKFNKFAALNHQSPNLMKKKTPSWDLTVSTLGDCLYAAPSVIVKQNSNSKVVSQTVSQVIQKSA